MPATGATDVSIHPVVDAMPGPVAVSWSFPETPEEAWTGLACAGLDAEGRFRPSLGCFLVACRGMTVLVDAGIGPGPNAYLGGLRGTLPAGLGALGLAPGDVDLVVFTHLHMDHIGWASGPEGPRFPKARYVAPDRDVAHFAAGAAGMGPHHAAAYEACLAPLVDAGRVERLADGAEIAAGLRYLPTPGHTPGHQSVLIEAAGETIAVTGDVFHCPAQVERPDWSHRADHDAAAARESRRAFLRRAQDNDWLLACGHFRPGLQFGRVAGAADAPIFVPEAKANHQSRRRTAVPDTSMEADT